MKRGRKPGTPKTGGAVKGTKHKKTIERESMEDRWKAFYEERSKELNMAQWDTAKGVVHLMAKDLKTGQFTKVSDPDMMQKVLNSGETYYRLHANNPDGNTIKDIYNRLFGMPTQKIQQDVTIGMKEEVLKVLQNGRQFAAKQSKE